MYIHIDFFLTSFLMIFSLFLIVSFNASTSSFFVLYATINVSFADLRAFTLFTDVFNMESMTFISARHTSPRTRSLITLLACVLSSITTLCCALVKVTLHVRNTVLINNLNSLNIPCLYFLSFLVKTVISLI